MPYCASSFAFLAIFLGVGVAFASYPRYMMPKGFANTFFNGQMADRELEPRTIVVAKVPDYVKSGNTAIEMSIGDAQLVANGAGTERPARAGQEREKGRLNRKNCFFSPLQCSFYY